jgi:hypothetical protein
MKKKTLKSLQLNKKSVSNLSKLEGGQFEAFRTGSQNDSRCGYSCDPNLCGSVEPWGCNKTKLEM